MDKAIPKVILEDEAEVMLARYKAEDKQGVINRYAARNKVPRAVIARFFADHGLETPMEPAEGEFEFCLKSKIPPLEPKEGRKKRVEYDAQAERNIRVLMEDGLKLKEIAERLGYSCSGLESKVAKMRKAGVELPETGNKRWTREQTEKLADMIEQGVPAKEIAAAVGRPLQSVYCKVHELRMAGIIPVVDNPQKPPDAPPEPVAPVPEEKTVVTDPAPSSEQMKVAEIAGILLKIVENAGLKWTELNVLQVIGSVSIQFEAWGGVHRMCLYMDGGAKV